MYVQYVCTYMYVHVCIRTHNIYKYICTAHFIMILITLSFYNFKKFKNKYYLYIHVCILLYIYYLYIGEYSTRTAAAPFNKKRGRNKRNI